MLISRRRFALAATTALTSLSVAPARPYAQSRRVVRVAFLSSASTTERPAYHAFRKTLRDHGWIEGQNLQLTFHLGAGAGQARLAPLAREIAASGVDAVLGDGRVAMLAMADVTRTIPIVGIMGIDPVKFGLADSLARPGRNITGITVFSESLNTKRLELLREMAPAAQRIGVLFASAGLPAVEQALKAGTALGLDMRPIAIQSLDDLAVRLAAPELTEIDAFLVGTDGFLDALPGRVVEALGRFRGPAIYPDRPYVEAGGLAAYGVSYSEMFIRLAGILDRVLRGTAPGTIPFEQPERFDLTLNQRTARQIGMAFPPLLLAQAKELID